MIKIKCIICDKEIKNPRVGQLCCDKKMCKDKFSSNMIELWKMENPNKVKNINKKSTKQGIVKDEG